MTNNAGAGRECLGSGRLNGLEQNGSQQRLKDRHAGSAGSSQHLRLWSVRDE